VFDVVPIENFLVNERIIFALLKECLGQICVLGRDEKDCNNYCDVSGSGRSCVSSNGETEPVDENVNWRKGGEEIERNRGWPPCCYLPDILILPRDGLNLFFCRPCDWLDNASNEAHW